MINGTSHEVQLAAQKGGKAGRKEGRQASRKAVMKAEWQAGKIERKQAGGKEDGKKRKERKK